MENYYWNEEDIRDSNKLYILIIYDIASNKVLAWDWNESAKIGL